MNNKQHRLNSSGWDLNHFDKVEEFVEEYDSPISRKYLSENQIFNEVVEAITHRKVNLAPKPVFWTVGLNKNAENIDPSTKYHNVQFLHSDVIFPTVKIWIYLNDVNKDNAAFVYAKGSQKVSKSWAIQEYKMSLNPKGYGCITDEEAIRRGFIETNLEGTANTVIISNTWDIIDEENLDCLAGEKQFILIIDM